MRSIVKEFVQPTCRLLVTGSPSGLAGELGNSAVCRVRFYLKVADFTIAGDKQQILDLIRVVNVYVDQLLGKKIIDGFSHDLFVSPQLHLSLTTVQLFDLWAVLDALDQEFVLLPTPEIKKRRSPWWLIIVGVCVSFGVYWWYSNQSSPPESPVRVSQTLSPDRRESAPAPLLESVPEINNDRAVPMPNSSIVTASRTVLRIRKIVPTSPQIKLSIEQKLAAIVVLEDHWQRALPTPFPPELSKNFAINLVISRAKNSSIVNIQISDKQRKQQQFLLEDANKLNSKLEFLPAGKYIIHVYLEPS